MPVRFLKSSNLRTVSSFSFRSQWTHIGPSNMQKKPQVPRKNSNEQVFDFDLEVVKASVESGVVSFPRGLKANERKEWVRKHLQAMESNRT